MASGIALAVRNCPSWLLDRPEIIRRIHGRGGEEEVRFWYREPRPILPVLVDGQWILAPWGRTGRARGGMPATGWVNKDELQDGPWQLVETHSVTIPANAACDNGIWYRVREGIEGVLVYDTQERPVVYVLVTTASHYFRTMTRCYRMPILIGEVI